MRFLYDELAGMQNLEISGESFKHLKARRVRVGDILSLRNLKDGLNYEYEIEQISRSALLRLIRSDEVKCEKPWLKLAWAVIDTNEIEKALPILNELGVGTIFFVYSDFSQKNIRLDLARFKRILCRSSEQCGRNSVIEFKIFKSSDDLVNSGENIILLDFGGENLDVNSLKNSVIFIGAEGGFSERERMLFSRKFGLKSKNILKSITAVTAIAVKALI